MPLIVGGELANENDWPWMSALVFTIDELTTSLDVAGVDYDSSPFLYAPTGQASAVMVDCGIGDSACDSATGKLCLIARGEINFSEKVNNCQAGGGIGAIIYNNSPSKLAFTLGEDFSGTIPVISISQSHGAELLGKLDSIATISNEPQTTTQIANCGASFIGTKWVLTAAHCVSDISIDFLKVNVGEYDLTDGASNAKAIASIYIHPEYNEGAEVNNDIAIIELVESINHPAITLLNATETTQLALDNSPATVIGWGNVVGYGPYEVSPGNSQPDQLRQVELTLLTNKQCKDKLVQTYKDLDNRTLSTDDVGITDSMICAHFLGGGRGSCQGDSGGPLVVNTNQGWQQVGIVSYGIGCADANFPDIYTRVGQFTDWINSITQGIAIETSYSFPITPQNKSQTQTLNVTNNSVTSANLTFSLATEMTSNHGFNLVTDHCAFLAAKQSCQIQITFDAKTLGKQNITIKIDSNAEDIPTSQAYISAQSVAANTNINTQLSNGSTELLWFSGGDKPWQVDNTQAGIISGDITDGEQSSVLLTFSGSGSLSFDWSVSSEENSEAPEEPFDALYLIIDGEQISFISGEIGFETVKIDNLSAGDHQVTWLYKKDASSSAGQDQGFLKNVAFTASTPSNTPSTPTSPNEQTSNDSSGGSTSFNIFIGLCIYLQRRLRISAP